MRYEPINTDAHYLGIPGNRMTIDLGGCRKYPGLVFIEKGGRHPRRALFFSAHHALQHPGEPD